MGVPAAARSPPQHLLLGMGPEWVPARRSEPVLGRVLCLSCLLGWYDDDDYDGCDSEN